MSDVSNYLDVVTNTRDDNLSHVNSPNSPKQSNNKSTYKGVPSDVLSKGGGHTQSDIVNIGVQPESHHAIKGESPTHGNNI